MIQISDTLITNLLNEDESIKMDSCSYRCAVHLYKLHVRKVSYLDTWFGKIVNTVYNV